MAIVSWTAVVFVFIYAFRAMLPDKQETGCRD